MNSRDRVVSSSTREVGRWIIWYPQAAFLDGMLLLSVLVVFVCSAANTVRWLILKAELKELEEQLAELRHEDALRRERERIMKQLEKETE